MFYFKLIIIFALKVTPFTDTIKVLLFCIELICPCSSELSSVNETALVSRADNIMSASIFYTFQASELVSVTVEEKPFICNDSL